MTIYTTLSANNLKARFTDNIRRERIPFADVTIKKRVLEIISTKGLRP